MTDTCGWCGQSKDKRRTWRSDLGVYCNAEDHRKAADAAGKEDDQ